MLTRRALPWIVLVGICAALGGALLARMLSQKPLALHSGTWLPQPRTLAPFRLADLDGLPYGNAQLQGHPTLVYFGFTYCPDLCPTTLALLHQSLQGAGAPPVQVLFVTVDPERDTPAVLRAYLAAFDARFRGLSGGAQALAPLLHSLNAIAERHELPGGSYTMDHSGTLYLLDAHGALRAVFSPPFDAAQLRADLTQILAAADR